MDLDALDVNTTIECSGNVVSNNVTHGIYIGNMAKDRQISFRNGTIEANSTGPAADIGVNNSTSYIADFQYNDWGYPTGPNDPDDKTAEGRWYNPVGQGQEVTDYVDYRYFTGWGTVLPAAPSGFTGSVVSPTSTNWSWTDNTTWESG